MFCISCSAADLRLGVLRTLWSWLSFGELGCVIAVLFACFICADARWAAIGLPLSVAPEGAGAMPTLPKVIRAILSLLPHKARIAK